MRKMRITSAFFAAIVAVGGLSGLAQGATEGPLTTTTPIPATGTDWSSSLAFPQFNPSLGTLESVELILNGSFSTTITVTNTNALGSSSSGTAQTELQISAQDAGLNLNTPELDLVSPTFPYSLAAGGSTTSGLITKSGTDDETYTAAGVLSEFTGLGSYALPASTFTDSFSQHGRKHDSEPGNDCRADRYGDLHLRGT
jgi:hypothetical protein